MNLKMISCPKCNNDFPELRKTEYGYNFCVECSTVEPLVGITTVEGTGDHTYNGLIIMDQSRAKAIAEKEGKKIQTFGSALKAFSDIIKSATKAVQPTCAQ